MAFMEWSSTFSIGVPVFDEEHKKLIAMINALHEGIVSENPAAALRSVEGDLIEYAIVHFQHEEMFFRDYIYPGAEEHIAQHAEMKKRIFAYRQEVENNPSVELCGDMLKVLRDWLANHIMAEDKKFGAYLCERGHGTTTIMSPR